MVLLAESKTTNIVLKVTHSVYPTLKYVKI